LSCRQKARLTRACALEKTNTGRIFNGQVPTITNATTGWLLLQDFLFRSTFVVAAFTLLGYAASAAFYDGVHLRQESQER
jgi:hypothetical protein